MSKIKSKVGNWKSFTFNPMDNGGEAITEFTGTEQKFILNSYCATNQINMLSIITPENIRELADLMEKELKDLELVNE